MEYSKDYWQAEVRDGFLVPTIMKKAWAAQFKLLEKVDKICQDFDIHYWCDFGTLLGAVRHQGFIPWDDDIDISMMRRDMDKLMKVINENDFGLSIMNIEAKEAFGSHVTRIMNSQVIQFNEAFLEEYYGFPYAIGIDIFPIDNLPNSKKERELLVKKVNAITSVIAVLYEGNATPSEADKLLGQLEDLFKVKINRKNKVVTELWNLVDTVFDSYNDNPTREQAHMFGWFKNIDKRFYKSHYFNEFIRLPFEGSSIVVPKCYKEILSVQFGNYMERVIDEKGHEYPFFDKMNSVLADKTNYLYEKCVFDHKYIERKEVNEVHIVEKANEIYTLLDKSNSLIIQMLQADNIDETILDMIDKTQQLAIRLGNIFENNYRIEESKNFINEVEKYAENLYILYNILVGENSESDLIEVLTRMNDSISIMANLVKDMPENSTIKKVLIVVGRANTWSTFDGIYKELKEREDIKLIVMCSPVADRGFTGKYGEFVSEQDMLPDYVEITDYQDFIFDDCTFDAVLTCDSYENYDLSGSIMTFFYANSLQKYAKKVVYISPYDIDNNFDSLEQKSGKNMNYYVKMPGVAAADKIVVKYDNFQRLYKQALTEWAGEETKDLWEGKVESTENKPLIDIIME
ncbi:MAG: LicD family protein [Lachnospiraceae bacterium]|nr:LicD family protein [Lachnospiraceae bacterium]